MPELRDELTEALADRAAEAAWEADRMASYGLVWAHQSKDTRDRYRRMARAALKALAAAPGVVVTHLPKPRAVHVGDGDATEWETGIDAALVSAYSDPPEVFIDSDSFSTDQARSLAAALLAAAVLAEGEDNRAWRTNTS